MNRDKKIKKSQLLKEVLFFKQQFTERNFIEHIKMVKNRNIKQRSYYFFNNIIILKDFDEKKFEIRQKKQKSTGIYYIGHITIKKFGENDKIDSVNALYLIITQQQDIFNAILLEKNT